MKKFIVKLCIFLFGFISIIALILVVPSKNENINRFVSKVTNSSDYYREGGNGGVNEIIPKIMMAQEDNEYTKLILGDSVCKRLFRGLQEINDEYLLLGTNQAMGMAAQYLLAEQFIENHEHVTDIYIVMIGESFRYDFGTLNGYQYAVMPFVETDLFYRLDSNTIEAAEKTYGKMFLNKTIVNLIDYSDLNRKIYFNLLYKYGTSPISSGEYTSDIVIDNLLHLQQLCETKNINLHVLPAPMPATEGRVEMLEKQEQEFEENGLSDLMELYYDCITLYPVEAFPDGTHPGGEREELNAMIQQLQEKSGLLEGLILSEEE